MHPTSLEQLFREAQATEPYIEDAGFTEKLRQQLRLRNRLKAPSRLPIIIQLVAAVIGTAICYQLAPLSQWIGTLITLMSSGLLPVLAAIAGLAFALVAALMLVADQV